MIDPTHFRNVLGAYPTGICVITAQGADGRKHAMVVGSFTSISLDPPLVGFFPAKNSGSWAEMAKLDRFAVNVLGTDQLELCRRFTSRTPDKFEGLTHGSTPGGQPLLDGVIAWLDCTAESVHEVGDHYLVVGRVEALDRAEQGEPLLFHSGAYRRVGDTVQATPGA